MKMQEIFNAMMNGDEITFTQEGEEWINQGHEANPISNQYWQIQSIDCNSVDVVSDMHWIEGGLKPEWICKK